MLTQYHAKNTNTLNHCQGSISGELHDSLTHKHAHRHRSSVIRALDSHLGSPGSNPLRGEKIRLDFFLFMFVSPVHRAVRYGIRVCGLGSRCPGCAVCVGFRSSQRSVIMSCADLAAAEWCLAVSTQDAADKVSYTHRR